MRPQVRVLARAFTALAFLAAAPSAFAADWYVDAASGSDGNAGTVSAPFKTFFPLNRVLQPGDTAHILPGTYNQQLAINVSGTKDKPITISGVRVRGQLPKIVVTGNFAVHFGLNVGWVRVRYLDVRSTDKNGIWTATGAHHLVIANNVVHDCGASGIGSNQADYLNIHDNAIFRNAFTGPDQGSGINVLWMKNYDNAPGVHNIIRNNVIYGNANKVFKPGLSVTQNGNGIKIDDTRHFNSPGIGPAYTGVTLIENNVIFDNGGRGVQTFQSDHVVIRANTIYGNNWDTKTGAKNSGEVHSYKSGDVRVFNNILYSLSGMSGSHVVFSAEYSSGGPVIADYNLHYGAKTTNSTGASSWGAHNVDGDPQFVVPTKEPALADYRVRNTSPALSIGNPSDAPRVDFLGNPRPKTAITAGAYQVPVP